MSAQDHLSPGQLGDLASRINDPDIGGFSVRAYPPGKMTSPTNSYMVGLGGLGQDGLPLPVQAQTIGSFAASREKELRPEGRYLGGWNGGKMKKGALDVSQAVPNTGGQSYFDAQRLANASTPPQHAIGTIDAEGNYGSDLPSDVPGRIKLAADLFKKNRAVR